MIMLTRLLLFLSGLSSGVSLWLCPTDIRVPVGIPECEYQYSISYQ